jgi:hypothetical protein
MFKMSITIYPTINGNNKLIDFGMQYFTSRLDQFCQNCISICRLINSNFSTAISKSEELGSVRIAQQYVRVFPPV